MRQLEGRQLADEGAKPKGKEQPAKYDKAKQGNGVLSEVPNAYNAAADAPAPAKVRSGLSYAHRSHACRLTRVALLASVQLLLLL